ncbi:hypothetical protein [Polaromonas aquatica]|uniref:hypothetical protein n=1 Tax=Polaromonas aquatica TaxID=332657 RepID=UPI003D656682
MLVMQANVHNGKTLKYLRQIAMFFVANDYLLIWEYPRFFVQKSAPWNLVTTASCAHFFASEMRERNSGKTEVAIPVTNEEGVFSYAGARVSTSQA